MRIAVCDAAASPWPLPIGVHADGGNFTPVSAGVGGEKFFVGAIEGVHKVVDKGELALKDFDLLLHVVPIAAVGSGHRLPGS